MSYRTRTYIDTGVLITALRGSQEASELALSYLNDPLRDYVSSDYVKVELLPKCRYHKNLDEEKFYEEFFDRCTFVPSSDDLLALAIDLGGKTGVSGIDAVHVACAVVGQASELITGEKSTKPMHRVSDPANGMVVISVNP